MLRISMRYQLLGIQLFKCWNISLVSCMGIWIITTITLNYAQGKPNGSKWHMKPLPCFVRLTQTRGHNGLESQNRKIKLVPLLHFVVGVSWILMNKIMITPFQFNPFTGTLKSRQHSESLVHHIISQTSYLAMILI